MPSSSRSLRRAGSALALWQPRQWAVAGAGAAATALLIGVPTAVVPSPLFSREVPVQWWNIPVLAVTAVLAGLVLCTYVRGPSGDTSSGNRSSDEEPSDNPDESGASGASGASTGGRLGSVGGVLSFLAIGCPVCNKLVMVLLGASGALSYWAPLQPLVALVSVALLAEAALRRLTNEAVCAVPAPSAAV